MLEIEPEKWIAKIAPRPLLILHGTSDDTVPLDHAFQLHRAAGEPKQMQVVEGAGHRLRESPRAIDYAFDGQGVPASSGTAFSIV